MFEGFRSAQDILETLGDSDVSNARRRIQAMQAIKAELSPPVLVDGITRLRTICNDILGVEATQDILTDDVSFADGVRDLSNKAIVEGANGPFHDVMTRFIDGIGLLSHDAKKSKDNKLSNTPGPGTTSGDLSSAASSSKPKGEQAANSSKPKGEQVSGIEPAPESFEPGKGENTREHPQSQNDTEAKDWRAENQATSAPQSLTPTAPNKAEVSDLVSNKETVASEPFCPLDDYEGEVLGRSWEATGKTSQERILNGELMKLPGILPPPPAGGTGEQYGSWLEGEIFHKFNFSIKIRLDEDDDADDLIEMLSEFHALPDGACQTYGARTPLDPAAGDDSSMRLFYAGRYLGFQGHTLDMAADELSRSVMKYFEEFEPRSAEFLNRAGCEVRCDPRLAAVLAAALDIEKFFIEHAPDNAGEGSMHDIRGSISADNRLDVRHVMDRSIFTYFTSGVPLADTLVLCLNEFRHAQLSRYLGRNISTTEFDTQYKDDWFLELDEFKLEAEVSPTPI
jgi:hypothetical protein